MKTYTPAEVRQELDIQDSTLRKYSLLLEEEGLIFERHKNNRRIYTELHVKTLKRSLELKKDADMTLETAVKLACKEIKAHPIVEHDTVTSITPQRHDSDVTALLEEIDGLKKVIKQQEADRKERDSLFLKALENLQGEVVQLRRQREREVKLAIETKAKEEEEETALLNDKSKGIFGKWFGRKKS